MPKLKTERIIVHYERSKWNQDTKTIALDFKIDINVAQDGSFTCTLPQDVASLLESSNIPLFTNGRRDGRKGFFEAATLEALMKKVKECCQEYATKTLTDEVLIIRYVIETGCSYVKNSEGEYFPNGRFVTNEEFQRSGFLNGTLLSYAATPAPFGMRIWTQVCWKRSYGYKSGVTKVEYEHVNKWDEPGEDQIHWLAGIVANSRPAGKEQEIICTQESAAFFVSIYKFIFKMNEAIKSFAENPETIQEFIESKKQLLLA